MKNDSMKIAVIGSGRWGMNHVRTAFSLLGEDLAYVVDANPAAEQKVKEISPSIRFLTSIDPVLADPDLRGVIIATPAETHHELAKRSLLAGKNVLVEKPITLRTDHALELNAIADEKHLALMVGHILLYHPAIVMLKKKITEGMIGKLQYIYSNRLNLGAIRSEENILWSFAPHDISVIQYLTESDPVDIQAQGAVFLQSGIEDTTMTLLRYPGNVHAHIYVSWLHPFKEQRLVVIGDGGMFVFEDSLPSEKLRFYPKGFHKTDQGFEKFDQAYHVVDFPQQQPLVEEQKHFFDCITNHKRPLTDGRHAAQVLKILEQATERLHRYGR